MTVVILSMAALLVVGVIAIVEPIPNGREEEKGGKLGDSPPPPPPEEELPMLRSRPLCGISSSATELLSLSPAAAATLLLAALAALSLALASSVCGLP